MPIYYRDVPVQVYNVSFRGVEIRYLNDPANRRIRVANNGFSTIPFGPEGPILVNPGVPEDLGGPIEDTGE